MRIILIIIIQESYSAYSLLHKIAIHECSVSLRYANTRIYGTQLRLYESYTKPQRRQLSTDYLEHLVERNSVFGLRNFFLNQRHFR